MSNINLRQLIEQALLLRQTEQDTAETSKLGSYRVGNTGLKIGNRWLGKCPRTTLLRSKGIQIKEEDPLKHVMFSGGVLNEEVWMRDLRAVYSNPILREEEIPTKWLTEKGTPVTGRPDIVLCTAEGNPELGLELKMASSVWTVRDVLFENLPKFDHLCQAAHYMWQLGIPFKLCYASYVEYPIVGWMQGKIKGSERTFFPHKGAPGSEYCAYNEGEVKPKKVRPFIKIYDIKFDPLTGLLLYSVEGSNDWTPSIITIEGIQNYFNGLDKLTETSKLPPRPETINVDGKKDGYSICDFCPVKSTCDKHEGNTAHWLEAVGRGS